MAWLTALWKYKSLIGIGLAVAVIGFLWLRVGSLQNNLERERIALRDMTEQRDKAVDVANKNAAEAERINREREETVALLEDQRAKDLKRQAELEEIYKEIHNAPKATSPAGPRLTAAHRRLQQLTKTPD